MKFNEETFIDFIDKENEEADRNNFGNDAQSRNKALAEFYREGNTNDVEMTKAEKESSSMNYIVDHEFGNIMIDCSDAREKQVPKMEISAALKYMRMMEWNDITFESNRILVKDIFLGTNIFSKILNKIKGVSQKNVQHRLADF